MALYLSSQDVTDLATEQVLLSAARKAVEAERDGQIVQPPRMDVEVENGFLRIMAAAVDSVMGVKVMTLAEEIGTRYLLLVYNSRDGRLLAALDADEVTRLRTAATTTVAGEMLVGGERPRRIALVGSGFEAEGHLRLMSRAWSLEEAAVFSPNSGRRNGFADRMASQLGISVTAVNTCTDACGGAQTVVLATKSTEPVVDGGDFAPGAVVLSIGSTRPTLRELDRDALARAGTVLADDPTQVMRESGDIIDALDSGAIGEDRIVSMGAAAADPGRIRREPGRDLLIFKSVGTAVSDLALAQSLVEAAEGAGMGSDIGDFARLKRFANAAVRATATSADGAGPQRA